MTDRQKKWNCTPLQIQRYRSNASGPRLDRIDIQIEVAGCDQLAALELIASANRFGRVSSRSW